MRSRPALPAPCGSSTGGGTYDKSFLRHVDATGAVLETRALPRPLNDWLIAVKGSDVWVTLMGDDGPSELVRVPATGPPITYPTPNLAVNGVASAGGRAVWFTAMTYDEDALVVGRMRPDGEMRVFRRTFPAPYVYDIEFDAARRILWISATTYGQDPCHLVRMDLS
ncbi:MAG: hypothetical protein WD004_07785 [Actinomycetota bacterium]